MKSLAKPRLVLAVAASASVAGAVVGCSPADGTTSKLVSTFSPATGVENFIGRWHVHGATMDIAGTTGTIVVSSGPCSTSADRLCHETDQLAVSSDNDTQLDLVVTAVSYADNTGATAPAPPGPATSVGDSMQLVSQAPGLLKRTAMQGFPGWVGGNPYWCGPGISPADATKCGA